LKQKDPEFFAAVIQPYLANKRDKTYLDHWLLGAELSDYLQLWNFQRLNVAERILLGARLQNDRPAITQNILDLYQLSPTPRHVFDRLFDVAVKSDALDARGLAAATAGVENTLGVLRAELNSLDGDEAKRLADAATKLSFGRVAGQQPQAGG
ncbi:MAG: hypothetical protein GTO41_14905, partial [Burkholderiales bacterium]|nr:hypothetical protein [Burkholderiales bacterium]